MIDHARRWWGISIWGEAPTIEKRTPIPTREPVTHDYTHTFWGHNYYISISRRCPLSWFLLM